MLCGSTPSGILLRCDFFRGVTICARDLWKVCNDYDSVADAFIQFKNSKVEQLLWSFESALVLDDSCTRSREFALSLMGKVKEVSTIPNLYIILLKEGFSSVNLTYIGGLRVLIELDSLASKENSHYHVSVGYWSKVYCIRDKELDAWTLKFLVDNLDNSSSDDESIDADEGRKYGDKEHENIKENSEVNRVSESSCIHGNEFMHENVANIYCKETIQSKDPFNIYEILRKNKDNVSRSKYVDQSYPPGFTRFRK
ncbi:hypothetical protein Tco_0912541 [Tanacetum coccineum]